MLSVPMSRSARRNGRAELDEHVQGVESAEMTSVSRCGTFAGSRPRGSSGKRCRCSRAERHHWPADLHRIDHMLSGTRANIAVKIFGDDLPTLRQLASQVQSEMSQVAESSTSRPRKQTDIPTLKVRVDPAAAARRGLATGTVADALQTARVGHAVGQISRDKSPFRS